MFIGSGGQHRPAHCAQLFIIRTFGGHLLHPLPVILASELPPTTISGSCIVSVSVWADIFYS